MAFISPLVATFWINFLLSMIRNACEIFASKHRKINIFAWSSRRIGGWNKERIESFVGPLFFFSFNLLNWEKSISGLYSLNLTIDLWSSWNFTQVLKIYKNNVNLQYICQNSHSIKNIEWYNLTQLSYIYIYIYIISYHKSWA